MFLQDNFSDVCGLPLDIASFERSIYNTFTERTSPPRITSRSIIVVVSLVAGRQSFRLKAISRIIFPVQPALKGLAMGADPMIGS
jgi:hypothetical protein